MPGGTGGAERMSVLIGKLLPRDKFEVHFVIIGKLRTIIDFIPRGYIIDYIPVHNKYCFSITRIWWKIKIEKPDLVFTSQAAYNSRVVIASKIAKVKVLLRSSGMIGNYSKLFYIRKTYSLADRFIAQHEDMRQEMIRILKVDPSKVFTLYNPIDIDDIKNKIEVTSPFLDKNHINYVFVGNISYRKAQDVVINALSKIQKDITNAHIYFIGGFTPNDKYYLSLTSLTEKLRLKDSVHFIGYDSNPYRWVKYCNCFVFPSRREGLPNALIEASYIGVPCVASKCLDVIPSIIKNGYNGYVTDVDDIDAFAEGMKNALKLKDFEMIYKVTNKEDVLQIFESI